MDEEWARCSALGYVYVTHIQARTFLRRPVFGSSSYQHNQHAPRGETRLLLRRPAGAALLLRFANPPLPPPALGRLAGAALFPLPCPPLAVGCLLIRAWGRRPPTRAAEKGRLRRPFSIRRKKPCRLVLLVCPRGATLLFPMGAGKRNKMEGKLLSLRSCAFRSVQDTQAAAAITQ